MTTAAGSNVSVFVNDSPRTLTAEATVAHLADELGLAGRKGVAIAINGTVVPRGTWPDRGLRDGDRILVIRATQGG